MPGRPRAREATAATVSHRADKDPVGMMGGFQKLSGQKAGRPWWLIWGLCVWEGSRRCQEEGRQNIRPGEGVTVCGQVCGERRA